MSDISQRKKLRVSKKVIPHLKKAIDYYEKDELERAEQELILAKVNYKKEKTLFLEIAHDFASLSNNLGVKYIIKRNYNKAFQLLSKALEYKLEWFPNDNQNIKGTFESLVNAGLLCCKFDELTVLVEKLSAKDTDGGLKSYLDMTLEKISKTQNNEPLFFVAGMQIGNRDMAQSIDGFIHFPKAFENIEVDFDSQLILTDHASIDCSFSFFVNSHERIPTAYEVDSWKKICPPELQPNVNNATPNLIIFLSEDEHIPENSIKLKDDLGNIVEFDFKIVFTDFYIPSSYPRFGYCFGQPHEIPNCKSFQYFRGKAAVFQWDIQSNSKCKIELTIKNFEDIASTENQFNARMGILLPFKKINYHPSFFRHTNKLTIDKVIQKQIKYYTNRDNPSGFSLVREPNSLSIEQFNSGSLIAGDPSKQMFNITPEGNEENDDYSILAVSVTYRVSDESLSIAIVDWEQPIPAVLSNMLMDERFGFPPLCLYDILNNSKEEIILNFITSVEGFTYEQKESKAIFPYSRTKVNHSPLFMPTIENLTETREVHLRACVLKGGQTILEKTKRNRLLALDTMVLEVLNPLTRRVFNLQDFLAVWVTPHDKEIESIISIAKQYYTLEGYPPGANEEKTCQSTYLQIEALFMALKEIGISYVDSSLSFGWSRRYASQRIKFPSSSIKTKSANCIDGAVLFASLIEHIGIQPLIVIVPGHALIGWRPSPNSKQLGLLETTQISTELFEAAVKSGNYSLSIGLDKARQILQKPTLTLEEAIGDGIIRFIDVAQMREKKIFPKTTF